MPQGETTCAMAGGSAAHVAAADAVFYPDVLVHCEHTADPVNTMELTEARLVVEVLSPGTQQFDRGAKLKAFRQLPGLQHIVLSSQEQAAWACHRVPADAEWWALQPWPRGAVLPLEGLGLSLPWGEVYDDVGLA